MARVTGAGVAQATVEIQVRVDGPEGTGMQINGNRRIHSVVDARIEIEARGGNLLLVVAADVLDMDDFF